MFAECMGGEEYHKIYFHCYFSVLFHWPGRGEFLMIGIMKIANEVIISHCS